MRKYGFPYMGGKWRLADSILQLLPPAEHFYDLFCGGGAISDCAARTGKFRHIHVNDIATNQSKAVASLLDGTLHIEPRWVSREEFMEKRLTDPIIRMVWSFGNNGKSYLYAREIEPWKKAVYYARALHDNSLLKEMGIDHEPITRKWITDNIDMCRDKYIAWVKPLLGITPDIEKEMEELKKAGKVDLSLGGICGILHADAEIRKSSGNADRLHSLLLLEKMANFNSCQSLESFERIQAQERILDIHNKRKTTGIKVTATEEDYRDVDIIQGSTVYCDIPYEGCAQYNVGKGSFDTDAFWEWARELDMPVVVSSYTAPEDFITLAEFAHRSTISDKANMAVKEKCFLYKGQEEKYRKLTG